MQNAAEAEENNFIMFWKNKSYIYLMKLSIHFFVNKISIIFYMDKIENINIKIVFKSKIFVEMLNYTVLQIYF